MIQKFYITTVFFFISAQIASAQVKIGSPGIADPSASLEITGGSENNKGLLLPKLSLTQRDAILSPAVGLLIYNTSSNELQVNSGTTITPVWKAPATEWRLTGNAGTNPITNFIGTTDNQPLALRANNTESIRFLPNGNIGIGTHDPLSTLSITPSSLAPKITLYDGGENNKHHGFGASDAQMNYHVKNTTDSHVFYVGGKNGDGTELLRITGIGNVGVGTSSPLTKLSITPNIFSAKITMYDLGDVNKHYGFGVSDGQINYHVANTTDSHVFYAGGKNGNGTELVRFYGSNKVHFSGIVGVSTGSLSSKISLYQDIDPTRYHGFGVSSGQLNYHVSNTTDAHVFFVGGKNGDGSELVRIKGNGNVGIGTDSPSQKLQVNGNILANNVSLTSDSRLKTNVLNISKGIDEILKLRPVSYSMLNDSTGATNLGFIAQELEIVIPEVVNQPVSDKDFYSVNYTELIPILTKAIQELKSEIEILQHENKLLKENFTQISSLNRRLVQIEQVLDVKYKVTADKASGK